MPAAALALLAAAALAAAPAAAQQTTVHLIPHSHCDPGWLSTFEDYYARDVRSILTNVFNQLDADASKTFNWAEISFFSRWYDSQSPDTKERIHRVISRGQFVFIGSGWVQNDEANPTYDAVIDQVTLGHDWVFDRFGVRPRIAWQVDPFGHSSLTPLLFAEMGYEAMVINRIPFDAKLSMKKAAHMEFVWKPSHSRPDTSIFTHVLHTHYAAIEGFDFENPGVPTISDRNVKSRADAFVNQVRARRTAYTTDQLLVPFGDDFKFKDAYKQYSNMDQLIAHINANPKYGVRIKYSTLEHYFDAVRETKVRFPAYLGDFFPYADNSDSYWTGYYSTRPVLKGAIRRAQGALRSAEILFALSRTAADVSPLDLSFPWSELYGRLDQARRNVGLVQHHDGVTGTSKSKVVGDYLGRLDSVQETADRVSRAAVRVLLGSDAAPALVDAFPDHGDVVPVIVQNPLAWRRREVASVEIGSPVMTISVVDDEGESIPSQMNPGPSGGGVLYFLVDVPPLGIRTYFVHTNSDTQVAHSAKVTAFGAVDSFMAKVPGAVTKSLTADADADARSIENDVLRVDFGTNGLMARITNKVSGQSRRLSQELLAYSTSRSGAYIFRAADSAKSVAVAASQGLLLIQGPVVHQAIIYVAPNLRVECRLFQVHASLDAGNMLQCTFHGSAASNKEVVHRLSTDIDSKTVFFTENGAEVRKREYNSGRPVHANYYPMSTAAFVRDDSHQLTVITTQSMGVTSPSSGQLEFMVHRNLRNDDGRGLGEGNNDNANVAVSFVVTFDRPAYSDYRRHALYHLQSNPAKVFVGKPVTSVQDWRAHFLTRYAPMARPLPPSVHLMTLAARDGTSDDVVVRLRHIFEKDENPEFSVPVQVDMAAYFPDHQFASVRPKTLALTYDLQPGVPTRSFPTSSQLISADPGNLFTSGNFSIGSQNTDEEGVFLSDYALKMAAAEKDGDQQQDPPAGGRQLTSTRRLLAVSDPAFVVDLVPMQFASFVASLSVASFVPGDGVVPVKATLPNTQRHDKQPTAVPAHDNNRQQQQATSKQQQQQQQQQQTHVREAIPPPLPSSFGATEFVTSGIIFVTVAALLVAGFRRFRTRLVRSRRRPPGSVP